MVNATHLLFEAMLHSPAHFCYDMQCRGAHKRPIHHTAEETPFMLDFTPVREKQATIYDITKDLTKDDLRKLTDEMLDAMTAIIQDATDADVVFVPVDPNANDTFGKAEETELAWTLGHVVLHATASSEEGAAQASSFARGIVPEGRSRYEPDWRTVTTVAQLRQRLAESRHMRHAFLDAWPDEPHLDIIQPSEYFGPLNANSRFALGLYHDDGHLAQLREIMRQAREARKA
jgi:hypothetical protein